MILFSYIITIVFLLYTLMKSADLMVETAIKVAKSWHVNDFFIGLTVISMGTSAPEFVISLIASLDGKGDISLSNIVGSNIFNTGLILWLVVILSPISIRTNKKLVYRDGSFLVGGSILLFIFLLDGVLSRYEGFIFLWLLFFWLFLLFKDKHLTESKVGKMEEIEKSTVKDYFILLGTIGGLVLSGKFLVVYASEVARMAGLSEWVIGITIVAFGTSLPEMVTSLLAIKKGSTGISLWNLVGSNIFNILGVLGLTMVVNPVYPQSEVMRSVGIMMLSMCLLVIFMRNDWKITKIEGGILIVVALGMILQDVLPELIGNIA